MGFKSTSRKSVLYILRGCVSDSISCRSLFQMSVLTASQKNSFLLARSEPCVEQTTQWGVLLSVTRELGALPLVGLQTGLQVGLQVFVSLCRYSAWTGLWLCSTLIASSTLNHFLFLPVETFKRRWGPINRWRFGVVFNDSSATMDHTEWEIFCYCRLWKIIGWRGLFPVQMKVLEEGFLSFSEHCIYRTCLRLMINELICGRCVCFLFIF